MSSSQTLADPTVDPKLVPSRVLHTMIRVMDLEKSLAFYVGQLGMKLLRRKDYPDGKFTLAFLGYGDEKDHTAIELTHNWDQKEPYQIGTAFGHLAVGVLGPADRAVDDAARRQDERVGMVLDIKPVADIFAFAVYR